MSDKKTLLDYYMKSPLMSHKWRNYFSAYEELLKSFKGKNITFVDTFNALRRPTWAFLNRLKHDARD